MKTPLHYIRQFSRCAREAAFALVRANRSGWAGALRQRIYRTRCLLDTQTVITNPANFTAPAGAALYHGTYILNTRGTVRMGHRSHLGAYCYVNAGEGAVALGDDVAVGPGSCLIAHSNHYAPGERITSQRITGDIVIGDNVLIGAHCTILPGTRLGHHVILAAGSVAKGELAGNAIYGGAPARLLREGWHDTPPPEGATTPRAG